MTDEKTDADQQGQKLQIKERIKFWLNEVSSEVEKNMQESRLLEVTRRAVEKAYQATEAPLHIAQECLYHREQRKGIDLVHDQAEIYLFKEIRSLNNCQTKLFDMNKKVTDQLQRNRLGQRELEKDLEVKESFTKPGLIQLLLKNSRNLKEGINKINTKFIPESWEDDSFRIITQSQKDRERSSQLGLDADNLIDACSKEISNSWNVTNKALSRRATEALEANTKTEKYLLSVQQEIFDVQKNIELMRKAILDKSNPMKVAQTRLEARSHRKGIELCKDDAQTRLIQEVKDIGETIETLYKKIKEAEGNLQQLQMTRTRLEADLHFKINSLFIDREKCLGMRRSIPIITKFK